MFEGKVAFEVGYKKNGMEYEFLHSADGVPLQMDEQIDGEMLPESVVLAIKKAYSKADIKEAQTNCLDGVLTW